MKKHCKDCKFYRELEDYAEMESSDGEMIEIEFICIEDPKYARMSPLYDKNQGYISACGKWVKKDGI